jgi:hypothetical protein
MSKKSKKYAVYAKVVGTKFVGEFEAESKSEAIEQASAKAHVSLCHSCAKECEDAGVDDLIAEEIKDS